MLYIADAMPQARNPVPSSEQRDVSPADAEYTIDELVHVTGVPSRTIRFYQSKGALMAPLIRGRVAFYTLEHVERLKLIAQLQDRGLRIDAIAGLARRIERGELDLASWLGVEKELTTSWAQDQARTVTEAELTELSGSKRPGLIADLLRAGMVERRGEVFLVESPALLSLALKLEATGVELSTQREARSILDKHIGRAVSELTELALKQARGTELAQQSKVLETLRPLAGEAVRLLFGRQVERALRKLLESGELGKTRADRRTGRRPRGERR